MQLQRCSENIQVSMQHLSASFQTLNRYNSFCTFTFVLLFLPIIQSHTGEGKDGTQHLFLFLNKPDWRGFCGWWTSSCVSSELPRLEETFKITKSNHQPGNFCSHPPVWYIPPPQAAQPCPQYFSEAVTGTLVGLEPCPSNGGPGQKWTEYIQSNSRVNINY